MLFRNPCNDSKSPIPTGRPNSTGARGTHPAARKRRRVCTMERRLHMIGTMRKDQTARSGWRRRLRRSDIVPALLFASPWIIGFLCFQVYPIASSVYYSFTAYNIMQPPVYVGLANFQQLFTQDDLFKKALSNTAIFSFFSVPLDLLVAMFFAILLNRKIPLRPVFRAIFYFPRSCLPWPRPSCGPCFSIHREGCSTCRCRQWGCNRSPGYPVRIGPCPR